MDRRNLVLGIFSGLTLSACGQAWQTGYDQNPSIDQSVSWRANKVTVIVPRSLTVSEANAFAPQADIVWRGEPLGDRHAQVQRLLQTAAERGTAGLTGKGRGVDIRITLNHFHALTQKARTQLTISGVHNINFAIEVTDSRTGEVLAAEPDIDADLVAFSGEAAQEADAAGQTQKVRIVAHVANVISGWLGTGADVRGNFTRIGL